MKRIHILLLLFFILFFVYIKIEPASQFKKDTPYVSDFDKNKPRYEKIDNNLKELTGVKQLKINPTVSFNYLNKSDIYNIRKKYVKNSIFYTQDYEPSDEVFGQITDKKPWYGLKYYNCAGNTKGLNEVIMGDSEESRFINNPNALIGLNQWAYTIDKSYDYKKEELCTNTDYSKMLKNLIYKPETNTLIATFKRPKGGTFDLEGINARDFGYNYIYASKIENVEFLEKGNISKGVYKLQDFLHTGNSCGIQGGCNNCSPHQPYLDFKVEDNTKAKINIKLWRKEPKTPFDTPDINYDIVLYTY